MIPLSQSDKKRSKTLVRRLESWFSIEGRSFPWRTSRASNYQKVVCEVLLQRTRAETVAKFFPLFIKDFPSWKSLATAKTSKIAKSLTFVQENNKDVEIGSYPFFRSGKVGVSIVIRSDEQSKIEVCNSQILKFVNQKKIEIIKSS